MTPRHLHRHGLLTRRTVLLGGVGTAAVVALGACGSSDSGDAAGEVGLTPADEDSLVLAAIFSPNDYVVSTIEQRMVFALAEPSGLLVSEGTPEALTFEIQLLDDAGGNTPYGEPIEVARYGEGVPQSYYPLRATFDEPGTYRVVTTVPDGGEVGSTFEVVGPAAIPLVQPGSPMRNQPTPTVADPTVTLVNDAGQPEQVEVTLCTRDPECPLHELSLQDALATGKPTAFLVSTPAFCQTAACGPVLDLMVQQVDAFPEIQFIHCEVYADDKGPSGGNLMPVINQLGLTYEPSLFLVGTDGTLVSRLDNAFDRTELVNGLTIISTPT